MTTTRPLCSASVPRMRIRADERKQLLARTEAAMRKRELALKMLQEVEDELAEIRIKEKERRANGYSCSNNGRVRQR